MSSPVPADKPYRRGVTPAEVVPARGVVVRAVTETLDGWGRELDNFQKFWWMDWRRLTADVVAAIETGVAVGYEDELREAVDRYADVIAPELRDVLNALDEALAPSAVGRWLLARSRELGGRRPIDVIAAGDLRRVGEVARRLVPVTSARS